MQGSIQVKRAHAWIWSAEQVNQSLFLLASLVTGNSGEMIPPGYFLVEFIDEQHLCIYIGRTFKLCSSLAQHSEPRKLSCIYVV